MKIWIYSLVFAMSSLAVKSQSCPSEHFSAVFTTTIDGSVDKPQDISLDDPELTFFKTHLKFRDSDIQHTIEDAIKFFNYTYGIDFSNSAPNERNEYLLPNARMSPYILSSHLNLIYSDNLWIRTGNTYTSCYYARTGGLRVRFLADQMVHGSYGGTEGKPVGPENLLLYGFDIIEVCQQSPIIIQFQSPSPVRAEPIDEITIILYDTYNRVLGQGIAHSIFQMYPDPKGTGQLRIAFRKIYTFPS